MRICFTLLAAGLCWTMGCDQGTPTEDVELTSPSTQAVEAPPSPQAADAAAFEQVAELPLGAIPFTATVPSPWKIEQNSDGRQVLRGVLRSGQIEILMSQRPALTAEAFTSLIERMSRAASQPVAGGGTVRVTKTENLTVIEQIDLLGDPNAAADVIPVSYNIKYFVTTGTLEYPLYEINIADLSKQMFDQDGEMIRSALMSLRYTPQSATQP